MNLERTEALIGTAALGRLRAAHVAVYGLGGVGGWCAEALLRSGVGQLTLVDDDVVQPSNLNRQCCATNETLGLPKAEAMKARLLSVDPSARVIARVERFLPGMEVLPCDLVVDAIDSVDSKCALVISALKAGIPLLSSLGAAKRLDPTRVSMKCFSKVSGDGLARAMRQRFKKFGAFPPADFLCAVSDEPPVPMETLGSMMPVTATFGLVLASAAIRKLCE